MRVRIPFFYKASGVLASGSFPDLPVPASFLESFEHEIPEATTEDFPFAFFYIDGPPTRGLPHVVRIGSGGSFYRSAPWHAGRGDIKKSLSVSCLAPAARNPKAAYEAYFSERGPLGHPSSVTSILEWYNRGRDAENRPASERFSSITETDRPLRLLEAQEFAERMVVIDGELVFRCDEPKIVVSLDSNMAPAFILGWSGSTRFGTVISEAFGVKVGSPAQTRFFRADDIDGALAFVANRGIDNEMQYAREFICRLPQLMTFDPAKDFIERSAAAALAGATDGVGAMDTDAVQSWLALRDGIRSIEPAEVMGHVRALVPHIQDVSQRVAMKEVLEEWDEIQGRVSTSAAKPSP
ncbi:hypothetical protein [Rhizobium sp. BK176]|uniref:hypothetical protein n=1 Tax=Rhizobium sp. BK176 TaxID=2587071 RepID=UPI00216A0EEA|nr:hypothetical protein [Rhizobium sp. BK176]MCS4088517.1 hypothetical protein [Rhizobium sp. BK176]